jgi:hypothetical protein
LKEIEDATPPFPPGNDKVYVLAWRITEDERPHRVERCLVLKVLDNPSERGRWCLAQLARVPNDNLELMRSWMFATTHVAFMEGHELFPGFEYFHVKRFDHRPTNKDVYGSFGINEVNWKFDLEYDEKFVGCLVCEENWKAAIGEKPTRYFGGEKKPERIAPPSDPPLKRKEANGDFDGLDKQEVPLPPPKRTKQ